MDCQNRAGKVGPVGIQHTWLVCFEPPSIGQPDLFGFGVTDPPIHALPLSILDTVFLVISAGPSLESRRDHTHEQITGAISDDWECTLP